MDDITRRYAQHLVQYEPFTVGMPLILNGLRQMYFGELLKNPRLRTPALDDAELRGKIAALADIETFVQRFTNELLREHDETQAPAAKEAEWVDPEPFARVRTD